MPKYVLHYFDSRGRAEITRLIAAAGGIEYTDSRITDWPATKGDTPLGQLPYLEIDNLKLPQSLAIARYFAKEANLAGRTNLEQAQADAIVDTVSEGFVDYVQKVYLAPAEQKDEARRKYVTDSAPKYLDSIEKLIGFYGKNGYSVGDGLTWADLIIYEFASYFIGPAAALIEKYSGVQKVKQIVETNPKVAAYLQTRK